MDSRGTHQTGEHQEAKLIRLAKGVTPQILAEHAEAWTRELVDRLRGGNASQSVWIRYKHEDIKMAVRKESSDKCIYCESKIMHVTHGDIEHIKPKSRFPAQTFDWRNLGLVCTRCNGAKGNRYDEAVPPVNPYEEDPAAFLLPVGDLIWAQSGNDRGQVTEALVKLNRADLIERRRERLEAIRRLVDAIARSPNQAVRDVLMEQLCLELMSDREYVFVSRAAARLLGFRWEDCPQGNSAVHVPTTP